MLLSPVFCQAEPLTKRFIFELKDNTASSDQNFSIIRDLDTLLNNPTDIVETSGCAERDLPLDNKRHRTYSYDVKTTFIESIFWQWLYVTNLLVAFELFLTTKDASPDSNPNSWLLLDAVIAAGWLFKSDWSPDSALFNPIGQQAASKLKRVDLSLAITTMMPGSEHGPQRGQPPESSDQQTPQAISCATGYFTHLFCSNSGDGNESPQQHSHTLGLNCFVYPCNAVCQFRKSSDSSDSAALECEGSSTDYTGAIPGQSTYSHLTNAQCNSCNSEDGVALDGVAPDLLATGAAHRTKPAGQKACNLVLIGEDGQLLQCGKVFKNTQSLSSHKSTYHTGQKTCDVCVVAEDGQLRTCGKILRNVKSLNYHKKRYHTKQETCDVTLVGVDGQQRLCGKVCKSALSLTVHKSTVHTGQKTCSVAVVGEGGQQRPCGKICKNAQALYDHKKSNHSGQKNCNVTVVGVDGQQRSCGKVCKSARTLTIHKSKDHSEERACNRTVVTEDGQQLTCGKICKNLQTLSYHKRKDHTGRQTCNAIVIGEDGQSRPCGMTCKNVVNMEAHRRSFHTRQQTCDVAVIGQPQPCSKVCRNARALSDHKSKFHTGQQTCTVAVVGKDGQQQPCGTVFKNTHALWDHKSRIHSGQKTCDLSVIGEDGQQLPCGKVYKNAEALRSHKKIHRKRKSVDVVRDSDPRP
ncbi:hypothetical protein [Endozoicomonas sp. 8E]|uniref:hypothetical protein n=1 Tax=Endozoicomonas sp. 8E TaxID=3035692 RepID=UPI002938EDB8|nr:hypothetical protein [Endozoicomonas sp. 8E]WOG26934.1 hypothetical protein P6910_20650 [Endozoicomonas sp. 8E]